jgi:hypothetical protein
VELRAVAGRLARAAARRRAEDGWPAEARHYDAFGRIRPTLRELDWKTLIFSERAVPISPNAW